ncbi:TonB-dependent receptor [Acinetobacter sp. c2-A9]|uniref:TonB-dependent receptor n=1 Tax=Acinetobacter sp. c2-A9 TaxID=3342802 RepID=UPI0035BA1CA2
MYAQKKVIFNPKSKKYLLTDYIDPVTLKYTQKYDDYGLSPGDVYTNDAKRPRTALNPQYQAGEPESVSRISKISDITENYDKKLGNSALDNQRFGISSSYFFDQGYVAVAMDRKKSHYGLPGFSLSNLNNSQDYRANLPVSIDVHQTKYLVESQIELPYTWLNDLKVNLAKVKENNRELVGSMTANTYHFSTYSANILGQYQFDLNQATIFGDYGVDFSRRRIQGNGQQRYLPDVNTKKQAVFVTQNLNFKPFTLSAGYRHENVSHDIQKSDFKLTNKSPNGKSLIDTKFSLNSYDLATKLNITDNIAVNARYAHANRAPEVNELYASRAHLSTMTQEEGNQKLKSEQVKSTELSLLLNYPTLDINATAYQHNFNGFYYLRSSGTSGNQGNRLRLKYWNQINTKVNGFEFDVTKRFSLNQWGDFEAKAFADLVKNKPSDYKEYGHYLVNIPTNRYGMSLDWKYNDWTSGVNLIHYAKPKYLGKDINIEVPLPGYSMLDLSVAKTMNWNKAKVNLFANVSNALNQDARVQSSPLRYIAPLPARSINAGVSFDF